MGIVADRLLAVKPSATLAVTTKAKELKAQGVDVIDLGVGEPDFPTPEPICKAAHCAIDSGKTRYTAPVGILELRKKICEKLSKENGLRYEPEQITVTSGAKHAVFNSLAALINPGDEVIIPAPYWVTYPELVKWLGGVPVFVDGLQENDFKITAEQLKKVCNDKTKAILMNNPCNPTGSVYSREELEALAKVIVENDLYCISDEVYEYFVYQGTFTSIASIEGMKDRSKSYCMTGWRVGYDASPAPIAKIIGKIQGQATHHPSNIAQYAALGALEMGNAESLKMREVFRKRRDFMVSNIGNALGQKLCAPEGAFYLFAPVNSVYGRTTPDGKTIKGSVDLCEYILETQGLAIVPGAAFGNDNCVRFSYAASDENLESACKRFKAAINSLK